LISVIPLRKVPRACHNFRKRLILFTTLKAHNQRMRACVSL